jgi:acetolactate synthase-1/2/3 large subunit
VEEETSIVKEDDTIMHGGQALLRVIERNKIDTIVSSPGSEWPPVWEALAELTDQGRSGPSFINCRHEALAVAVAAGYTKVTGRPQVVLLHATAGPLNAAMMLRAAYQERVPMVVCAGETIAFGEDHRLPDPGGQWLHDLCDPGGPADMLRRCVKWSERIFSPSILLPSLERAIQISQEPPAGPVLLSVPFESLMEEVQSNEYIRPNQAIRAVEIEEEAIQKASDMLLNASNPVVVTENLGRNPKATDDLVELCELLSIPVMESYRPAFLNFPRDHSLYLQYDRNTLEAADLIIMAGAVSPWYPANKGPKPTTKVLLIDEEYPHTRLPFWGYEVDLALVAPPAVTLEKLIKKVRSSRKFNASNPVYGERLRLNRERHNREKVVLREEAEKHAQDTPIDPRWLCHVLNEAIPQDAIIVEETTVHRTLIQNMIYRSQPMSYFARITGGLGVGLGYALGIKLALKERLVFMLIGDGAFHYNPAPSCLGLAQEYGAPIAIVLFNNQRYLSMERSLLRYFPSGAAKKTGIHYGSPIEPSPDYRLFAEVYGGFGIRVDKPEDIRPSIDQALVHLRQGRLALIDVRLNDYTPR